MRTQSIKSIANVKSFQHMALVITLFALLTAGTTEAASNVVMNSEFKASAVWSPKPCSGECKSIDVQLVLMDISKSMLKDHIFSIALEQVSQYIDAVPAGTYLVIGTFGRTADIVGDDFVTTPQEREHLKQVVKGLKATHPTTNFDETAKLIEWVSLKLKATHPDIPLSISVKVLTDEISDPDPDKNTFSIKEFFNKNLASGKINVMEVALSPSNKGANTPITIPANQPYVILNMPVNSLKELLQKTSAPENNTSNALVTLENQKAEKPQIQQIFLQKRWLILGIITAVILAAVLLVRKRRQSNPNVDESFIEVEPKVSAVELLPASLSIVERELPKTANGNEPKVLKEGKVSIIPNIDVTIGTTSGSTYVTTPIIGNKAEKLFSIRPIQSGLAQVKALAEGLTCNNQTLSTKGLTVALSEPFQLKLGNREWMVKPVFSNGTRLAKDALFATVQANRSTTQGRN